MFLLPVEKIEIISFVLVSPSQLIALKVDVKFFLKASLIYRLEDRICKDIC